VFRGIAFDGCHLFLNPQFCASASYRSRRIFETYAALRRGHKQASMNVAITTQA
jgi:hypothetical protein